eukprot:2435516-Pyramimonas_sp.AAC.1
MAKLFVLVESFWEMLSLFCTELGEEGGGLQCWWSEESHQACPSVESRARDSAAGCCRAAYHRSRFADIRRVRLSHSESEPGLILELVLSIHARNSGSRRATELAQDPSIGGRSAVTSRELCRCDTRVDCLRDE